MTFFPAHVYPDQGTFALDYFERYAQAAAPVDPAAISRAGDLLRATVGLGRAIFSCGNGGSAAIANHLVCDCLKGTRAGTSIKPRVFSLSTTIELITAIGNDIGYPEIFSYQMESNASQGDLLIAISSSGESPNIIRALETARELGMRSIAMVGFAGGAAAQLADVCLWVQAENYGIVEDVHQSLMHIFAQFLRLASTDAPEVLGTHYF